MLAEKRIAARVLAEAVAIASNGAFSLVETNRANDHYAQLRHVASDTHIAMYWQAGNRARPEFTLAGIEYRDANNKPVTIWPRDVLHYGAKPPETTVDPERSAGAIAAHILRWVRKPETVAVMDQMRERQTARMVGAHESVQRANLIGAALGIEKCDYENPRFRVRGERIYSSADFQLRQDYVQSTLDLTYEETLRLIAWLKSENLIKGE